MPYRSLSSDQIAAVAVALLGGNTRPVDIEDAAIKAYDLGPEWFCWRRHRDRVDLEAVREALVAAEQKGLVRQFNNGWLATDSALALSRETSARGGEPQLVFDRPMGDGVRQRVHERNRLVHTRAYSMYMTGRPDGIGETDFYEFAGMPPVATQDDLAECVARTDELVKGDNQLEALWATMRARFVPE